ncbi:uncharacterized protein T551_00068 [Pneumocystis jirovecii RU7]|uniref:WD repeat-containing protein 44 n=1 Tax=Pneumocystis jirovecii (strain RU7) TaxID=1408657 RepID=A0A0W4ZW34_PNEJ7|nr:uncharacterized protein T551_00068 [Pneumocystis jirovecii RU7]KTW32583.1 hypothetical protein T551_00068 [Pneumocystis jirovecii RU7]
MDSDVSFCFEESSNANVVNNSEKDSLSFNILKTRTDLITVNINKGNDDTASHTSYKLNSERWDALRTNVSLPEQKSKFKDKKLNKLFFLSKSAKNCSKNITENKDSNSSFQKNGKKHTGISIRLENSDSLRSFICLKYIKVKTNNKFEYNSNKLFLAQELYKSSLFKDLNQKKSYYFSESQSSEVPVGVPFHKSGAIWAMKFSRDGKYLATGGQDTILRVWMVIGAHNSNTNVDKKVNNDNENSSAYGKITAPVFFPDPIHEYVGHKSDVLDLSWSKNNFLLSSSMDKTVRLWHVSRKECLCCFEHNDFVTSIAFHPLDDRYFLSGSLDCKLRFWNIKDKTILFWNELPELITAVAFSPDGRMAIAGSFNGLCIFYETKGLRYHTQIHVKSSRGKNSKGSKITGIETFSTMPNSNDDVKLLITSNDSRIRIYNMRDKSLEIKLKGSQNTCSQIHATFSDDAKYVISGSEDGRVYIWKLDTDFILKKNQISLKHFQVDSNIVTVAIFAPMKSKDLLAASGDLIYNACLDLKRSFSYNSSTSPIISNFQFENLFLEASKGNNQDNINKNSGHDHGDIIICADYTGKIKVFRYNCASTYQEIDTISEMSSIKKHNFFKLFKKN